jgi:hypothetical protein
MSWNCDVGSPNGVFCAIRAPRTPQGLWLSSPECRIDKIKFSVSKDKGLTYCVSKNPIRKGALAQKDSSQSAEIYGDFKSPIYYDSKKNIYVYMIYASVGAKCVDIPPPNP